MRDAHSLHAPLRAKERKGFLLQNWWMIAFVVLCGCVYFQSVNKKKLVISSLDNQLVAMDEEKRVLQQDKEDLLLQINSQSDPAWVQLTLMKGLGLVPEGQLKVYFYSDDR